jgi:hypothetical protein
MPVTGLSPTYRACGTAKWTPSLSKVHSKLGEPPRQQKAKADQQGSNDNV